MQKLISPVQRDNSDNIEHCCPSGYQAQITHKPCPCWLQNSSRTQGWRRGRKRGERGSETATASAKDKPRNRCGCHPLKKNFLGVVMKDMPWVTLESRCKYSRISTAGKMLQTPRRKFSARTSAVGVNGNPLQVPLGKTLRLPKVNSLRILGSA